MSRILLERLRATAEATSKSWKKASISHCVPFCDQTSNCSHCSIDRVPKCGWKGGKPEILDRIAAKKTSAAMEAGYVGYRRSSLRACALARKQSGAAAAVQRCGSAFFNQVLGNHSALFEGDTNQPGWPVAGLQQGKRGFPAGERNPKLPPGPAIWPPNVGLFGCVHLGHETGRRFLRP